MDGDIPFPSPETKMIIDTRAPLASIVVRNVADTRPAGAANYAPAAEAAQQQSDASRSSAKGTEAERLLKELRDYIDKGPIVALREKILKSMNLTEEKLKAMTPDQQNAIEAEIARKIKEYLLEQQEAAKNPTSPQQAQAKLLAYQAMHAAPK